MLKITKKHEFIKENNTGEAASMGQWNGGRYAYKNYFSMYRMQTA